IALPVPPQQTYSLHKVLKILLRYHHACLCVCECVLICVCTCVYLYVGVCYVCMHGRSDSNLQYSVIG
uniref:Uncharacterized protein n=1 Tax=Lates calcarifer TaxID=8187 RepID=A0A4W6DFI5_LATCA